MTLVKFLHSYDTTEHARCYLGKKPSALQVLFGLNPSAVHVCSCMINVHVTHALGKPCAGSYVDVLKSHEKAVWMALF
jgi:hypothetical protein